ncbi:SRPBCC family protein [Azospirillum isscasi]|uniref:SRPBCC family protein n=1 Tax=Azospirillum isscasi TaxID=3053926 RepID=A0ABU0WC69_9PROT|nr:SRPBCC family protein [Azospirillum isscasi]MDQ2101772.1 SRPBCC family protein [Azospirillum isscasi]
MRTLIAVAAMLIALASPAMAVEVTESVTLPYPVDKVWQQIGPFCNVGAWHPAVESCTLRQRDGAQERVLALKGGGAIEERLLSSSASSHRIRYSILASPLPVKDYSASLSAAPAGKGTRVVWKARYTSNGASDEETRKAISGIFTSGFDGLKQKLASR